MGDFGNEFIRVDLPTTGIDGREIPGLSWGDSSSRVAVQNTTSLLAMIEKVKVSGGILAVPGRRFYLGLAPTKPVSSEVHADVVIESNVVLWFVPDGQLVPINKVKIEVRGFIDAGVFQIFDTYVEDPRTSEPRTEAGTVVFTRPSVSALYPEWWGAVPARQEFGLRQAGLVRRTTAALQACFDAAHRTVRDPNVAGNFPLRVPIPVVLTNDYVIDDELSVGVPRVEVDASRSAHDAAWKPYNFDGIVIRGARGASNAGSGNVRITAWPLSTKFRGEPAGGASDFPASLIPKATLVAAGVDEANRPGYGFRSLLGIRGVFGARVIDVAFDASGVAPRCVTLEGAGHQMHHCGFEGCSFENARAELVHIGGELKLPPVPPPMMWFVAWANTSRWTGGQDLSNLRFLRCRFLTSTRVPDGVANLNSRCAIFTRTSQSLGVGFEGCYFAGPANPMVHLTGGRYAFDGCHFRSQTIDLPTFRRGRLPDPTDLTDPSAREVHPGASTNGTDLFIDKPPFDVQVEFPEMMAPRFVGNLRDGAVSPACLTVRNVVSESPQFLVTFTGSMTPTPTQAATVLYGAQHLPQDGVRPSVFWAGPGGVFCVLAMAGCDFNRVHVAEGPNAPVVDMGNRTSDGGELFTFPRGIMLYPNVRALPR